LLEESANEEYIERLLVEGPPTEHGWLCSRWSCKLLALELFKERATPLSRKTLRRALHHLGFGWRRPPPVPPEKDSEEQKEQKSAGGCWMSYQLSKKQDRFCRMRPSWRPTLKWAFAGCLKENRSPFALPAPMARCGDQWGARVQNG